MLAKSHAFSHRKEEKAYVMIFLKTRAWNGNHEAKQNVLSPEPVLRGPGEQTAGRRVLNAEISLSGLMVRPRLITNGHQPENVKNEAVHITASSRGFPANWADCRTSQQQPVRSQMVEEPAASLYSDNTILGRRKKETFPF